MSSSIPTIRVRGLDYLDASPATLRLLLSSMLRERHGAVIFTPNAKIGAACVEDRSLCSLVRQATVLLPDGAGVLLASRRACPTHALHHRLPGIEAGEIVLHLCAESGLSVYFLGGKPSVACAAAHAWQRKLPTLCVAGYHDGYFEKHGSENDTVVRIIAQSGADVVFVCFGFPLQERWIAENRAALPSVHLFMGLGGSFDVWAGTARRAPAQFQRSHLEWLWRMVHEPRRFAELLPMLAYVFGN